MKKRILSLMLAIFVLVPSAAVSAYEDNGYADDYENGEIYEYVQDEIYEDEGYEEEEIEEQEIEEEIAELPFGATRMATLTYEAREIALYDFDYLSDMILRTAPTQNIFERRFGISLEDFLAAHRQLIYDRQPIPSITFLILGEDWLEAPESALDTAADYLKSLVTFLAIDSGGIGHFGPVDPFLFEQMLMAIPAVLDNAEELLELGLPQGQIDFFELHYEIFTNPAALRLFDLDPADFAGMSLEELDEEMGAMDPYNITARVIEPGRIAYFAIASFMNNILMDIEILLPFLEAVQDYEHLIIDLRGNGGGFAGYFPLVMSLILPEPVEFMFPEFFIADEITAGFFENPHALIAGSVLQDIVPAAQFVQEQGMEQFSDDDLELLDYAIVWQMDLAPIPAEFGGVPFEGKIWMLVDGMSASASDQAAKIAVNTGFATLAGEPSAGITGVIYTFAVLPNTGVLFRIDLGYTVDRYGRSIEEFGVIPEIANMPGLDALETVLQVINAPTGARLNTPVYIGGENTGVYGTVIRGSTLVPAASLTEIFESAEFDEYAWVISLVYGGTEIMLSINSREAHVFAYDDEQLEMPQAAQLINGEIFVPIRFIAETFGYDVGFEGGAVIITQQ